MASCFGIQTYCRPFYSCVIQFVFQVWLGLPRIFKTHPSNKQTCRPFLPTLSQPHNTKTTTIHHSTISSHNSLIPLVFYCLPLLLSPPPPPPDGNDYHYHYYYSSIPPTYSTIDRTTSACFASVGFRRIFWVGVNSPPFSVKSVVSSLHFCNGFV